MQDVRQGDPEACLPEAPDPLEAFGELVVKRKKSNHRTVRLRLFPNRYEEEAFRYRLGMC
jgi:hypothetical protein